MTSGCNLHCEHCQTSYGDIPIYTMDIETLRKILNWSKENEVKSLIMTGGELFLVTDILDKIELAHDILKCNIEIMTNLSNDSAITKEEQYEYLKKVFDPDIIFLSEKVSVGQSEDTFLNITQDEIGEKEQSVFDRGGENEACEKAQYLGTYGSYGISLTGRITEDFKPENVYVVGNVSQEEKEAMLKQVMEQIKIIPQETSETNSIKIKAEEIENGDIVKLIEELYA